MAHNPQSYDKPLKLDPVETINKLIPVLLPSTVATFGLEDGVGEEAAARIPKPVVAVLDAMLNGTAYRKACAAIGVSPGRVWAMSRTSKLARDLLEAAKRVRCEDIRAHAMDALDTLVTVPNSGMNDRAVKYALNALDEAFARPDEETGAGKAGGVTYNITIQAPGRNFGDNPATTDADIVESK